ncbi:MerR family transcriptional regulator [Tsukamurella pulmonis]|uniref:DNA-binding transcriptional regulator, MerR family n=1 Tax=Tsukamurella pulmonis TaxID=47312 RepID=A0A1H1DAR9_9ACTN|nr:MerR family transcriptional regulator [Tsukamurella pulmonis]KXO92409.1 MerR family transcriptional regulator [Tsukamurella pulmonis]SDQ73617.1 DNA-binding transcriptional regulator, MerR family [Tsukamurella pulmonis]SUP22261.1 DNA-binding transcriptional regulator CueR [Tsukamurella pulmonis]
MSAALGTTQVAWATGYSVQQVRVLEAEGVLAAVPRAENGYRRYAATHVRDLHAYRDLTVAVGPVRARSVLRTARAAPAQEALAVVSDAHADLRREREQAGSARRALLAVSGEAAEEDAPAETDELSITELAGAIGVRTSTLRFWERERLLAPHRSVNPVAARRYPVPEVRIARIVAELRNAGYRIPDVRRSVHALRELGDAAASLEALDARMVAIDQRYTALLRAGAVLVEIIAG